VFNSGRYKGKVRKSANVMLNDTTISRVRIAFSVEVVQNPDSTFPLVISPPWMDFSPVQGKKVMTKEVKIKNVSQEEIKLKVIDSPVGFFKIRFSKEKIKPSKEIDLEVRLNRNLKEDSFKKSITLELDDKARTRFTIPVKRETKIQEPKRK